MSRPSQWARAAWCYYTHWLPGDADAALCGKVPSRRAIQGWYGVTGRHVTENRRCAKCTSLLERQALPPGDSFGARDGL